MSIINPKDLIMQARKCEAKRFFLESIRLLEEAVKLLDYMITSTSSKAKKKIYLQNLEPIRRHKDELKQRVLPINRSVITIYMVEGATGFSYERIFGDFLDDSIEEIQIFESYLFYHFQMQNLVCFLELVVKKCKNLRFICLVTKDKLIDDKEKSMTLGDRVMVFDQLVKQLRDHDIIFNYYLKPNVHDRYMHLSNGTSFILGFGLDIYIKMNKFSLGTIDYNLRKCKDTAVHIHQKWPEMLNTENLI